MKFDFKFNLKFIIITLVVALIIVPILFNLLFMWDSGLSRGKTSDWFVLYGNIIGGLTGGFFTYLALLLTINDQQENKKREMRPKIDIPNQIIEIVEFVDTGKTLDNGQIVIELNNIGGSLAKNIECSLSLPNIDEVLAILKKAEFRWKNVSIEGKVNDFSKEMSYHMFEHNDKGNEKIAIGNIKKKYESEFIGSCIPLILNHDAKAHYLIKYNVNSWISYIIKNRNYTFGMFNKDELFNLNLEIKYSSDEFGEFSDTFKFEFEHIGIWGEDDKIKYRYLLKNTKLNNQVI